MGNPLPPYPGFGGPFAAEVPTGWHERDRSITVLPYALQGLTGPAWDDAAQINAAFAAGPTQYETFSPGGTPTYAFSPPKVNLGPYPYQLYSTINVPYRGMLIGQRGATCLYLNSGTSTAISWHCPANLPQFKNGQPNGTDVFFGFSGAIRDIILDGQNSGPNGTGIDMGDLPQHAELDVAIRNFAGTNGVGLLLNNSIAYTEHARIIARMYNCNLACTIKKVMGGSESFRYNDIDLYYYSFPGQNGVNMLAAHLLFGTLKLSANMMGSASSFSPWYFLRLNDTTVGGSQTLIQNQLLMFAGEEDLGMLGNYPQTILYDDTTGGVAITKSFGTMLWQNNWTNSNLNSASSAWFKFFGMVDGDANLVTSNSGTTWA